MSTTFKLKSWCIFPDSVPDSLKGSFSVNVTLFDTTQMLSQSAVDEIFSEGIKDTENSGVIVINDDSISHIIDINFRSSTNESELFVDCGEGDERYFEITKVEDFNNGEGIKRKIIEANFNLRLCADNDDELLFENGKLRYYYNLY